MSSVKKLTIKRGLRSPFSRKSSKKDRDEKEQDYDDDVATTDSKKGGVSGVANGRKLSSVDMRESSSRSRKWPFKGKSVKQRSANGVKTETNGGNQVVLSDATNNTNPEPGSSGENLHKHNTALVEAKCDREAGYATAHQNGYHVRSMDHEQYVTPMRNLINHDDDDSTEKSPCCGKTNEHDATESSMICPGTMPPKDTDINDATSQQDFPSCPEENLAPRLPPKPPSLRGRKLSEDEVTTSSNEMVLPPRPPARQRNRTMGREPNPPHLRGIAAGDTGGQYETVKLDFPNTRSGGGLAAELAKLPRQPWYWGPLTQEEAEAKLRYCPDGSFLVRDSSDERYLLSLSFNSHGRTLHTRIEYRNGLFSLNDSEGHASIVELVELAVQESRSGVYGYMRDSLGIQSYPAQLKNWVSRFTELRPLQHLCRFVIREVYPRHHIQRLPLPRRIKEYILENQY
ncbi:uncharacterized protein [Amphiura filiformis]|uniref:uncharacterized protein n=1 Tax=Amphiura filiformis TaxID=82378 RepID=UPI003B22463C